MDKVRELGIQKYESNDSSVRRNLDGWNPVQFKEKRSGACNRTCHLAISTQYPVPSTHTGDSGNVGDKGVDILIQVPIGIIPGEQMRRDCEQ